MELKVGQWVKCVKGDSEWLTKDKWYELKEFICESSNDFSLVIHPDNFTPKHRISFSVHYIKADFDLENPLDYNPDEMV